MADDLKLAVVIEALLNSKGFEDAKTALRGVAGQAAAAAPAIKGAGEAAKKTGESFGGTRGPVADLTRILLVNVGASSQAGTAAKAAGEAMYFLEGAVSASSVAMAGATLGASLLIPLIVSWMSSTKDQTQEQKALKQEIDETLPLLTRYAAQVQHVTESARLQLAAKTGEQLAKEADELTKATREYEIANRSMQLSEQTGFSITQTEVQNIQNLRGRLMDLQEAQRQGITVEGLYQQRIDADAKAQKDAAAATEARKRAQDDLNKAIAEGVAGQSDTRLREAQAALDKDSEALRKREQAGKQGKLSPELIQKLTEYDMEGDAARKLAEYEAESERLKRKEKLETNALEGDIAAQGLAAASSLFGNNKALAIAAAIADTYAGANKALAQGGYFGIAMAAAVILTGLANVQQIRKANPGGGFDDPGNDEIIRGYGRKWADDMGRMLSEGFYEQARGLAGPAGNTYHQTTINRGTTMNLGGVHGLMATSPTQFYRGLERVMTKADRFKRRTTLGR